MQHSKAWLSRAMRCKLTMALLDVGLRTLLGLTFGRASAVYKVKEREYIDEMNDLLIAVFTSSTSIHPQVNTPRVQFGGT